MDKYAQRIISTAGKPDGLAWQNLHGTGGGLWAKKIARAIEQGCDVRSETYHGYFFKVLKVQGSARSNGFRVERLDDRWVRHCCWAELGRRWMQPRLGQSAPSVARQQRCSDIWVRIPTLATYSKSILPATSQANCTAWPKTRLSPARPSASYAMISNMRGQPMPHGKPRYARARLPGRARTTVDCKEFTVHILKQGVKLQRTITTTTTPKVVTAVRTIKGKVFSVNSP